MLTSFSCVLCAVTGQSSSLFNSGSAASSSGTSSMFSFGSATPFSFGGSSSGMTSFSAVAASSTDASISSFASPSLDFSAPAPAESYAVPEQFKDRKAESSGEETDHIEYQVQAKVFVMKKVAAPPPSEDSKEPSSAASSPSPGTAANGDGPKKEDAAAPDSAVQDRWVDVGLGELHLNTYKAADGSTKGRLIMRADRTHRLILNAPILPHLAQSFVVHEGRYVRLASVSAEDGRLQQFLLKVKGKEEATKIVDTLKDIVGKASHK